MDLLRLLSLSAIVLSVASCVLVYVLHRQTTARLNALTQANMGITQTIHKLVSLNMNPQNEQLGNANGNNAISQNENDLEVAERIIVSDDESESDGDISDNSDSDSDIDSVSDDSDNEQVSNDVNDSDDSDNESNEDDSDKQVHMVSLDMEKGNILGKFKVDDSDDESDYESDVIDDDINDGDSDVNEGDDEADSESTPTNNDLTNTDVDESIDVEEVNVINNENIVVSKENHNEDNIETIELDDNDRINTTANLSNIMNMNMNNIDIDPSTVQELTDLLIEPLKSSGAAVSVSVSMSGSNNAEALRQFKVEELRRMAIENLNISEEQAKKMKKAKLIERLTQ